MAPQPPNPFSELSEHDMEQYRKNVERRQLGLSGTTHTHTHINTLTFKLTCEDQTLACKFMCVHSYVGLVLNGFMLNLQTQQEPTHTERHMD